MKDNIDSKTNSKLILDKYYQPIFPAHYLYVMKNGTMKDIQDLFLWDDGVEISEEDFDKFKGITYCFVMRKDDPDKHLASLIVLNKKTIEKGLDIYDICSHEASHAAFHILDYCSIRLSDATTEVFSFMTGWITRCCIETYNKKA